MYHTEVETTETAPENMDNAVIYTSNRNTIKTDLCLLLECVKFQMNCPDLQKQALIAITSICEKKEHNVDLLREMGGMMFVYNLFKSSVVNPAVRHTALFTLGTLADASVYCKNALCRKEMFLDLGGYLLEEDASLKQKSLSVYLLSVLVTSNKAGQTLAQTTGCIDILLNLFRNMFPESTADSAHICLWISVSNALCGCVNNPQNEETQRICVSSFPKIKMWLQHVSLPCFEVFRYLCSFIAMTVANNARVQESFAATGALETFVVMLIRLASDSDTNPLSCQLLVIIIKTMSACIANTANLASGLARYIIVGHLISVLASPHLNCEDRLATLILLGHCTEASEEHQCQLVQCGGLPLIITLLVEDANEEVRKFATFILQTCKHAIASLGISDLKQEEDEKLDTQAAEELGVSSASSPLLLQRGRLSPVNPRTRSVFKLLHSSNIFNTKEKEEAEGSHAKNVRSCESAEKENPESSGRIVSCSACHGTGSLMQSQVQQLKGGRDAYTGDSPQLKSPEQDHNVLRTIKCSDGEKLQKSDMFGEKRQEEQQSHYNERCAGCVMPFEKVTSRTFGSVLFSCRQKCDMHKVLLEATARFTATHRRSPSEGEKRERPTLPKPERVLAGAPHETLASRSFPCLNLKNVNLTPICKTAKPERIAKRRNETNLIPVQRGAKAPKKEKPWDTDC
ncbi:telomere repeats-binding bouquet formation protein 1 isoform X2 [Phyllopteryx taeniolatus]|uniref:telomere repeats-binding bouquet formation protein 1 isoform X2 n=1 Tax=Phyllopteryx taeniolatus TaxID=161469 RepID=UPI002AD46DAE|nr:telomere repeats-binding bouquet formation protein 1 isoform X2 [Phyllopteryx taeniolatus]